MDDFGQKHATGQEDTNMDGHPWIYRYHRRKGTLAPETVRTRDVNCAKARNFSYLQGAAILITHARARFICYLGYPWPLATLLPLALGYLGCIGRLGIFFWPLDRLAAESWHAAQKYHRLYSRRISRS